MRVIGKSAIGTMVRGLLVSAILVVAGCGNDAPESSAQVQNDAAVTDPVISAAADSASESTDAPESSAQAQNDAAATDPVISAATDSASESTAATDSAAASEDTMAEKSGTLVVMKTSLGDIELMLDDENAPLSVENFLAYTDSGSYEGTVFHRVIPGFMVQGGGFDEGLLQKETREPIKNEATNGVKNVKYTVAMARTSIVDSATTQFFINVADNAFLDHRDTSNAGYGYAVFGEVVSGQEVVDKIAAVETGAAGRFRKDVPLEAVVIESVTRK